MLLLHTFQNTWQQTTFTKFHPWFCLLVKDRVGTGHNVILQALMITTQGTSPNSQCFLRKNVKAGALPVQKFLSLLHQIYDSESRFRFCFRSEFWVFFPPNMILCCSPFIKWVSVYMNLMKQREKNWYENGGGICFHHSTDQNIKWKGQNIIAGDICFIKRMSNTYRKLVSVLFVLPSCYQFSVSDASCVTFTESHYGPRGWKGPAQAGLPTAFCPVPCPDGFWI